MEKVNAELVDKKEFEAAERAADPCMERLFEDLSGEAYKGAADLLRLLERGTGT